MWKAVNRLREEGYVISAVPNRGYCLADSTDILSAQGIQKYLEPVCQRLELHVLQETGSTNTLLREKAGQGAAEAALSLPDPRLPAGDGWAGIFILPPPPASI